MRAVVGDLGQGVLDGLPARFLTAGGDRRAVKAQVGTVAILELVQLVRRARDHDGADLVALRKQLDGAQEQGAAAEILVELVRSSEALAPARRGNDHADLHG